MLGGAPEPGRGPMPDCHRAPLPGQSAFIRLRSALGVSGGLLRSGPWIPGFAAPNRFSIALSSYRIRTALASATEHVRAPPGSRLDESDSVDPRIRRKPALMGCRIRR